MISSLYWEIIQNLHQIIDKLSITFDNKEQKLLKEVCKSLSEKTLKSLNYVDDQK